MERYEIDEQASVVTLVEAAARGEEVLLTQNGVVIAEITTRDQRIPFAPQALADFRSRIKPMSGDGIDLVREVRGEHRG